VDHSVDVDGDTPAALGGRDVLGMTGTKFRLRSLFANSKMERAAKLIT